MIKKLSRINFLSTHILRFSLLMLLLMLTLMSANSSQAAEEWQVIVLRQEGLVVPVQQELAYQAVEQAITAALLSGNIEVTDKNLLPKLTQNLPHDRSKIPVSGKAITGPVSDQTLFLANPDDINLALRFVLTMFPQSTESKSPKSQSIQVQRQKVKKWRFELSAYWVDLQTKKKIESHLSQQVYSDLPTFCDNSCLQGWMTYHAQQLAQELGTILVEKLHNLPRRYRYNLAFEQFTSAELVYIVQKLKQLPGFVHTTLLDEFASEQVLLHQVSGRQYRYISHLPADDLDVQLLKIMHQGDIAVNSAKTQGKNFVFSRSNMPYQGRYLLALLIVLILALSLLVTYRQRKQQLALNALQVSKQLVVQAAVAALTQSKKAFKKTDYYQTYSEIDRFFHLFAQQITDHRPQANNRDHKSTALAAHIEQLQALRRLVDKKMSPLQGAAIGQQALAGCHVFNGKTLSIARNTIPTDSSFAINYKRLSGSGKQTEFRYKNSHFFVTDQGSSNGSYLNGEALMPKQWRKINGGEQLALGGLCSNSGFGVCQFTLALSKGIENNGALILRLNNAPLKLLNDDNIALAWPKMDVDLASSWILLTQSLALGINDNGTIDVGCRNGTDAEVYLGYQNGFFLEPMLNKGSENNIRVNHHPVYAKVVLSKNAQVSINGVEFSLH